MGSHVLYLANYPHTCLRILNVSCASHITPFWKTYVVKTVCTAVNSDVPLTSEWNYCCPHRATTVPGTQGTEAEIASPTFSITTTAVVVVTTTSGLQPKQLSIIAISSTKAVWAPPMSLPAPLPHCQSHQNMQIGLPGMPTEPIVMPVWRTTTRG